MTVKEIFDHPAIKAVEMEILDTIRDEERCRKGEDAKLAVQHLLSVRKRILNGIMAYARICGYSQHRDTSSYGRM